MSGRWASGLTATAFAFGVGLLVAVVVSGEPAFAAPAAIPAAAAAFVWLVLHRRCTIGGSAAPAAAVVAALAAVSVLSLGGLALVVLPIAWLLGLATILTPRAA